VLGVHRRSAHRSLRQQRGRPRRCSRRGSPAGMGKRGSPSRAGAPRARRGGQALDRRSRWRRRAPPWCRRRPRSGGWAHRSGRMGRWSGRSRAGGSFALAFWGTLFPNPILPCWGRLSTNRANGCRSLGVMVPAQASGRRASPLRRAQRSTIPS
jgi:hypothetical protein